MEAGSHHMTEIDELWAKACMGDQAAFGDWAGRVERPLRRRLWRFARAIDVETVMQETLLRMWAFARDAERVLEGENASLRFAHGIAWNLARNMARKHGKLKFFPPEELDPSVPDEQADPPSDVFLMQHIRDCVAALSDKLRTVLSMRLERAHEHDSVLAEKLAMTKNTFLQNIVRARKAIDECLQRKGVHEHEAFR